MAEKNQELMEKIVSLCKRRGFIFPGSEIYGGLAGTFDYGPLGVALRNNIKAVWWKRFVLDREDMYGVDASLITSARIWQASGHLGAGFADPMVEDLKTKKRYRADHILEENGVDTTGMSVEQMDMVIKEKKILSPDGNPLSDARKFNMMFPVHMGAMQTDESIAYLRGETAPGMFVNFKNILDSFHPKLPFGMAQIGKAFRNEIAPGNFIFRLRELEQMEIEYFVEQSEWEKVFEGFVVEIHSFMTDIGLPKEKVHELEVAPEDRAHYSKRTIDFEFDYPFGRKELYGLAYRTDFDLSAHAIASGVDLSYFNEETKERFIPHCVEPSFGVDRTLLAVLTSAYTEDDLGGETRSYLKFSPKIAPVIVSVSPLLKNKPELVSAAREVFVQLKKKFGRVTFDDNGNIGKRYRRQDEIGTPFCVVCDFETIEQGTGVTIRDRDTGEQKRMQVPELIAFIEESLK